MKVRVQFYSQLRDLADAPELIVDLAEGATVTELLGKVYEKVPSCHRFRGDREKDTLGLPMRDSSLRSE